MKKRKEPAPSRKTASKDLIHDSEDGLKWVRFMDMHSGGSCKEPPYEHIYIQAKTEDEACVIFTNIFGHPPDRIACQCCGENYSIDEHDSLSQATAYDRNCDYDRNLNKYVERLRPETTWAPYLTLDEYLAKPKVLVLPYSVFTEQEKTGKRVRGHYEYREE